MFWLALLNSVPYFFFLYLSLSLSLFMIFDSNSSNIGEVLSINPSVTVFVFGGFNIHHNDQLTYSGGTDRPGELCYSFSISINLTQMVNFPTWIADWLSQSCSFRYFFFLMLVFVLQWLSLHWEILIMLLFYICVISRHLWVKRHKKCPFYKIPNTALKF